MKNRENLLRNIFVCKISSEARTNINMSNLNPADEDDERNTNSETDGEVDVEPSDAPDKKAELTKLLSIFFEPADSESYRMCKACANVMPGQRGGSNGKVVKHLNFTRNRMFFDLTFSLF